jgi:branched-chain amino acid transport system substrate-binding protein
LAAAGYFLSFEADRILSGSSHSRNAEFPLLLPGVRANTSPTDYRPIKQFQMMKFDGKNWLGGIVGF